MLLQVTLLEQEVKVSEEAISAGKLESEGLRTQLQASEELLKSQVCIVHCSGNKIHEEVQSLLSRVNRFICRFTLCFCMNPILSLMCFPRGILSMRMKT